jgi:hypothetical protein
MNQERMMWDYKEFQKKRPVRFHTIELFFDERYRFNSAPADIPPNTAGVFLVCAQETSPRPRYPSSIQKILYVGEDSDLWERFLNERGYDDWTAQTNEDQELVILIAPLENRRERERARLTLVCGLQPPCNENEKFTCPPTRVIMDGLWEGEVKVSSTLTTTSL